MVTVLGFSEASADSSACIIKDGKILAAVDEERIRRIKHCGGFPRLAIKEVMRISGIKASEIDRVSMGYKEILLPVYFKQSILNQRTINLNPVKNWRDRIGINVFQTNYRW